MTANGMGISGMMKSFENCLWESLDYFVKKLKTAELYTLNEGLVCNYISIKGLKKRP